MTTFSQRDYQSLLVGKAFTSTPAVSIAGLANGEIGIFTPAGVVITEATAATNDRFILAVGRGTGVAPLQTPVIDKTKVTAKALKNVVSAAEQVDYIGYNGTSGSIELNNSSIYRVAINMRDVLAEGNHGGLYIKDMTYKSDASATQAEIAQGLVKSGIANFSREASKVIRFERVTTNAGAANTITGGTDATHYTFTYGSKYVVGTNSAGLPMLGSDEVNATVVAGDYLRAGTAVTSPVYKIVTVTSGTGTTPAGTAMTLELDVPFQGATTSIAIGSTEYITAALVAAGDMGIKMTGIAQPFTVGKVHYKKVRWTLGLSADSFGATTVTHSVIPTEGAGQYEQIASLEWFITGNNGEFFRMGEPNIFPFTSMVSNITYRTITVDFQDGRTDSLGYVNTPKVVTLAIPSATVPDYAIAGTADDITDVLEVLLYGAAGGELAMA